jgi:hypothetical protein
MTKLRLAFLLGSGSLLAIAVAVGCGGDDSTPSGGEDAGTDTYVPPAPPPPNQDSGGNDSGGKDAGADVDIQQNCTSDVDGGCQCDGSVCNCQKGATCNFGPADAGEDADAGAVDNVTVNCSPGTTCNVQCGTGCTSTCSGNVNNGSTCNTECAANCTSTCSGTSACAVDAGPDSSIVLTGGADGSVSVGSGSTVTCQGTSRCVVECPEGNCTMKCQDQAAQCSLDCKTAPCKYTCEAGAGTTCEAGTTCNCRL